MFAASVPVPIPSLTPYLRSMIYLNAGIIGDLNDNIINVNKLISKTRASLGFGFTSNFSGVRIEGTYSIPFLYAPHDILRPWQIGFSLTMN